MFLLLNYFICCGFYFIFFLVNVRFQLRLWRILCMLYAFFWVITRRLEFMCRRFGTLCLFLLHRQEDVSRMILLTSTCLWRWNRQSVPKRRHMIWNMLPYDIFVNCSWVVTRWQYTFTHKQYIEQYKTNNTYNNTTILEECGPCPVLASITLAFTLQPRKKHGKTSVRIAASKNT